MPESASISVPVLEVRDLVKDYGSLRAVDHLSLEVRQGEVFGFLGPNGAGKTTSIRMMCGLLRPTSGSIRLKGRDLASGADRDVRSMVGICPQENILWSRLSCFEQLVFSARMYNVAAREARERADHLLEELGLKEKRNKMASTLSGGMKRRMNVIMALMHDPDILVFDEPEAGLDPQSRIMVRGFIREIALRKSVIITTHNMDEAERLAHRVAIIDGGKLLRLDTPERLKHSIGEGDILELLPGQDDGPTLSRIMTALEKKGFKASIDGSFLMVRGMDLLPRIPDIYSTFEKEDMRVAEMRIRENTLEDVFIHLTGKSLRS